MKKFNTYLQESSLSRLWRHNEKHDCGAMTAFRNASDCGEGERYTNADNKQRNKSLLAKLKTKGYGVTTLKGRYPEGGKTSTEVSYFIVDLQDGEGLEQDMKKLGEEFDQDSVLYVPKGSIQGVDKAYLIGTNRCENNWLGYHKTEVFNRGRMGYDSPIYTSYVNGRPFIFETVGNTIQDPGNGYGWWALNLAAKKPWKEIQI